jgi:hypothetical protein
MAHLGGGDDVQALALKYPRDYTRAALHIETMKHTQEHAAGAALETTRAPVKTEPAS